MDDDTGDWRELDWTAEYWIGDPQCFSPYGCGQRISANTGRPTPSARCSARPYGAACSAPRLYALDGSDRQDRPYTVTEQAYGLREESAAREWRYATPAHLLSRTPWPKRTTQWERGDQPMTQFVFTDDYDKYGQSCRQVSVAVARFRDYRVAAPAGAPYLATMVETQYAQRDDAERYIVDRVSEHELRDRERRQLKRPTNSTARSQAGTVLRKLFGQTFNYYDGEAFIGLPFGELGDFGTLVRSESMVLTEEILREAYHDPTNPNAPDGPPYLRAGRRDQLAGGIPKRIPRQHARSGGLHLRRWL